MEFVALLFYIVLFYIVIIFAISVIVAAVVYGLSLALMKLMIYFTTDKDKK